MKDKESLNIKFDHIADALAAIRNGECVVVVDDESRENEGDLICAAQFATPQQINFMATEARGLGTSLTTVCNRVPLPPQRMIASLGLLVSIN